MATDEKLKPLPIPLSGRWRTSVDGTQLSEGDFQTLQNMRYTDAGIKSIKGMTKINTTTALTDKLVRSGIHFRKDEPSESHVLVSSWDATDGQAKIYDNTTAIPNQGDFGSSLYTEDSNGEIGKFSNAPDGCIAYCNGKESLIWGGDEYRCGAFYNFNPDASFAYNYSTAVSNTLQDTENTATLKRTSATLDSDTVLLLNLNSDTTDSSSSSHTVTNNNVIIDTTTKKFGAGSGGFSGVGDNLTISDHADFNFADGTWTIDFWLYPTTGVIDCLYYQQTDANNYMSFYFQNQVLTLKVVSGGSDVIDLSTGSDLTLNAWQHVELVENSNDYYIFIDGDQRAYVSDTDRPANYSGNVVIGQDMTGNLDDFRVSKVARHTANFLPPQAAHGNTTITYAYIGSTRPLQGVKFYVKTANTTAATVSGSYWDGTSWASLASVSDGTASGGASLAQTGSITFTSTVSTAKTKILYETLAYWYLFAWDSLDQNTEVYYVTLDAPIQDIVDIWDGVKRQTFAYFTYVGTTYTDYIFNVMNDTYTDADPTTYAEIDSLAAASYQVIGFSEQMTGISFKFVTTHVNSTANTIATVSYWNGASWTSVGTIDDGTKGTSESFNQTGIITWNPPALGTEQTTTISTNDNPLFYYKVQFSQALSGDVQLYYVSGIPAQKSVHGYKFPVHFQNRLLLCSDQSGERNKILVGGYNSVAVFNGTDTTNLYFGDNTDLIAAGSLYTRYGGTLYENLIVGKRNATWLIDGTSPATYVLYKISDSYGVVSPGTFKICDVGFEIAPGINKHVAIWQAEGAIVIFDSNVVLPIHQDIEDVFDPTSSTTINTSMIHKSEGFYDEALREYHWLWASGSNTTLDKEYVYDLVRRKWFEIERTTGKYIQLGISVTDTNGKKYMYGAIDTGYLERLENGTDFDGGSIVSQFRTPDIPVGGWDWVTKIRKLRLLSKAKTTTSNSVAITHYGDTKTTGTSIATLSLNDSTRRVVNMVKSVDSDNYVFHSFDCSLTTTDENIGFEPIGLLAFYSRVRQDIS